MIKILNKKIAAKKSSAAWLQRELSDPYVARAKREGYRARAVYKLIEINEKFKFLKNGQVVVDLGAAPGGWSQFVSREFPKSRVIAMDLLEIKPIPNVEFYQGDFTEQEALDWLCKKSAECRVQSAVNKNNNVGEADSKTANCKLQTANSKNNIIDVVLSDMAPNTTGHQKTDHLRQMTLLEYAWDFALETLKPGGAFVAKSFTGGTTDVLLKEIRLHFDKVVHIKPPSSRKDSVEMFIVGLGFKK
jgi:23S rRNA (uridine2552-2'-O)-methyltransferase